jgi:UDP-glucose 4-epimerase
LVRLGKTSILRRRMTETRTSHLPMRIVVTGASGFIGRHVVAELLKAGHRVETVHRGEALPLPAVGHTREDVLSPEARAAAQAADAVVHLAGRGDVQASFKEPFEYSRLNALGSLNMLEGLRQTGGHLILASTQRVYAPASEPLREDAPLAPTDPYAVSKLVAEQWCRMYAEQLDVPTTVVRLFSVYGPGQVGQGTSGVVSIFLDRARRGEPLEVHSTQRRDLTYVGDVARGVRLAVEQPRPGGRVYNVATGVGTSLQELARLVCRVAGSSSAVVPPSQDSSEGDRVADISLARSELGYTPMVDLEEGVRRTARDPQ